MSVRFIVAAALAAQVIALPLLVSPAQSQSSTASPGSSAAVGAAPGTGLGEGTISTNSARWDEEAAERARRAGDTGASGVAGVMPIDQPSQIVVGVNPSNGASAELPPWHGPEAPATAVVQPAGYAVGPSAAYAAGPAISRSSFRSVTDCLNAAARVHAPLAVCER
jgi:hypothetical protein